MSLLPETRLHLQLQPALPWVDSQGNVRLPVEGFESLGPSARSNVWTQGLFSLWKCGVLGVVPGGDWARPIIRTEGREAVTAVGYSLGTRARKAFPQVRGLLIKLAASMVSGLGFPTWYLRPSPFSRTNDQLQRLQLRASGVPGLSEIVAAPTDVALTMETAWLHPDDSLTCIVRSNREADVRIPVELDRLEDIQLIAESSLLYDGLGFDVMSRRSWPEVQEAARKLGLTDGLVVASG